MTVSALLMRKLRNKDDEWLTQGYSVNGRGCDINPGNEIPESYLLIIMPEIKVSNMNKEQETIKSDRFEN